LAMSIRVSLSQMSECLKSIFTFFGHHKLQGIKS